MEASTLSHVYMSQGKLDEAQKMLQLAQKGFEKAKGPEDKLTLQATHDLGQLFQKQAKLGQSMEMLERALKGFEKVLDREHISIYLPLGCPAI